MRKRGKERMREYKVIAGNWKMNKNVAQTEEFIKEFLPLVRNSKNTVVLCVPYTDIAVAARLTKGSNVKIGAQNLHQEQSGAFTGEISAQMLKEAGAEYVIIAHSERRWYYNERNEIVSVKIIAALKGGLKPIVCIGETGEERAADLTREVLRYQIKKGFRNVTAEQLKKVIVAYEPIWAIGTGVTATAQEAEDSIKYIREVFAEFYGKKTANSLYIQYGGSLNEKNAILILSQPDIDGGLIGGSSLIPEKLAAIVNAV